MKSSSFLLALLGCVFSNCSLKTEQANASDTVNVEQAATQQPDITSNADSTILTYALRWKDFSVVDGVPAYYFTDRHGKEYSFIFWEAKFDFENSKYFSYIRSDDRPFPQIVDTEEGGGVLWKITVKKEIREFDLSGETGEAEVVIGMEEIPE